ncbi:hypothetical protein E0J20_09020 [Rhizobium leguminosarum bv. viciae]|nr:hypothetical protein E0J20_09020 [Rhizobium leguminosarum bv. viciae]
MRYIDTAFGMLDFAWKMYDYALEGKINLEELDKPLTFEDGPMVYVLPDKIFHSYDDLIQACTNNLSVAFGAAAITLNRSREEIGIRLAPVIETEMDQFAALAYSIRCAFAHDISEPKWDMRRNRYRRSYSFGGIRVDLTNIERDQPFRYEDIGGPDVLIAMKRYFQAEVGVSL